MKIGDIVRCINVEALSNQISIYKEYTVVDVDKNNKYISVRNDNGSIGSYNKNRFLLDVDNMKTIKERDVMEGLIFKADSMYGRVLKVVKDNLIIEMIDDKGNFYAECLKKDKFFANNYEKVDKVPSRYIKKKEEVKVYIRKTSLDRLINEKELRNVYLCTNETMQDKENFIEFTTIVTDVEKVLEFSWELGEYV